MKVAKILGFCKSCCAERPTQIYLVMRLTALFLFAACLEVQAHGYSQGKLTLTEKNVSLPKVFQAIEQQSDYHFFYDYPLLQKAGTVSLDVRNASLDDVLKICFKGQAFTYSVVGKIVTVVEKKMAEMPAAAVSGPPDVIAEFKGHVTNESGEPLQGATVEVQQMKTGTFTDERGGFTLKNVPVDAVLEISFTGYQKTVVKLGGTKSANIVLKVATNSLDQVQIIAYGNTTERLNTGDVTTVSSKDIAEQPISNPLAALEGRVPGMFITQQTGVPGGGFTVQIRGQNSIANGNTPFYVIDGVPYTSTTLGTINNDLQGGNPLSYINPSDIESIEVLKDADATSIYGSRAANGAVLITTKKGQVGATKLDLNVYSGAGHVTRTMDLMNTQQYLQMRHEAFANDGVAPASTDYDVNGTWDTTRYTDWQKLLIGNTAHYFDAQASMSGGNTNTQYLIGGGYHRETTVFTTSTPDQKASVHFNINSTSPDKRLRVLLTGSYISDKSAVGVNDQTNTALGLPPDAPKLYNADGTLNWQPLVAGQAGTWTNPLSQFGITYNGLTSNLIANSIISYSIFPALQVKASLGYNDLQTNEYYLIPTTEYDPGYNITSGSSEFNTTDIKSWIVEPQANYKLTLGKGILTALAGGTFQQNATNGLMQSATGFANNELLGDIKAASSVSIQSITKTLYKYNAVFGRINYNWQDKYILNLNARRDGSSRFGPGKQFSDFGAVGAAWVFSNEEIFKDRVSFLSYGKIRASYGSSGNDQIGDYRFLNLYMPTSHPYSGTQGLYPSTLFNPDLAWEVNKKWEGALELGFLRDRITLNASYYINRSANQLVTTPLSAVTGFSSIAANLSAIVQNKGIEFVVNSVNIKTKKFRWSSSLNLTIPKNKLVAYPGLSSSPYASLYVIGQPITIKKLYNYIGVNDTTGLYEYRGSKGGAGYNPSYPSDQTRFVNTAPIFYGGLQNSFQFHGFQLDILFQFVKQTGENFSGYYGMPGTMYNQPTAVLNRWQKPGDNKPYQQFSQSYSSNAYNDFDNYYYASTGAYSDASFIRLKNLSLSYILPESWRSKLHVQTCRVYIQGQNLLTITKYLGYDPETQSAVLPPIRVMTAGIQVSL